MLEILSMVRVEAVVGGAVAGLGYGLSGYFRNRMKTGDKPKYDAIDWGKLSITVGTAAVCGGIAGARGIGISVVEASSAGAFVAIIVEKVVKGIREWIANRKAAKATTKKAKK